MSNEPNSERPACDPDGSNSVEQERHPYALHPTEKTGPVEPTRNVRSGQAARELYQNHFPAEH